MLNLQWLGRWLKYLLYEHVDPSSDTPVPMYKLHDKEHAFNLSAGRWNPENPSSLLARLAELIGSRLKKKPLFQKNKAENARGK